MGKPLEPRDPNFDARVRASFARQNFMTMAGLADKT
jgi:hypothetical protein